MKRIVILTVLALVVGGMASGLQAQEDSKKPEEVKAQDAPKKKMKTRTELITREEVDEMAQGAGEALDISNQLTDLLLTLCICFECGLTGMLILPDLLRFI